MTIPDQIPPFRTINSISLPETEVRTLANGVKLYFIDSGKEDVVKLDLAFMAGRPFENKPLVSRITNSLMKEGSLNYKGPMIHQLLDYHGATLHNPVSLDTGNLTLFCLGKHFPNILPVFKDIILRPGFPQSELMLLITRLKQQLKMDLSKGDILGYRKITESIFGESHPYGYNSTPEGYDQITRDDCVDHHLSHYTGANCFAFYCGLINEDRIKQVVDFLQEIPSGEKRSPFLPIEKPVPKKVRLKIEGLPQTSLKVGCRLFSRNHEDYSDLFVVNTLLGGYFGSRLMKNIREAKGYTYNIYSQLDTMMFDGCFYISTELKKDFEKQTLHEISSEMEKLKRGEVDMEELTMVKNYLMGVLLGSVDGPLKSSEIIKTICLENLGFEAMNTLIKNIHQFGVDDIQQISKKYLNLEEMHIVTVG